MSDVSWVFYFSLLVVAILYSSVGHGGASGYLALMVLFGISPLVMKPTALVLNIFVSAIAFIQYYRSGNFNWKIFFPLALASVPASFLGGLVVTNEMIYKHTLGALLIIPTVRFIVPNENKVYALREAKFILAIFLGAVIGFISGMIGIGGGIILTPLLLLIGWANLKQAAAVSSLFILVNSISGLGGMSVHGISFSSGMMIAIFISVIGGLLGSYFGAYRLNQNILKKILAVVLLIASAKLLLI